MAKEEFDALSTEQKAAVMWHARMRAQLAKAHGNLGAQDSEAYAGKRAHQIAEDKALVHMYTMQYQDPAIRSKKETSYAASLNMARSSGRGC